MCCLKNKLNLNKSKYYRLRIQESSAQVQNMSNQNNLEIKSEQKDLGGKMVKKFHYKLNADTRFGNALIPSHFIKRNVSEIAKNDIV